ncbi:MAG TPA: hypothetical protein VK636_17630 [Gemmatimonadaceae bacterium]|nr:hypothetical protein [Gemmatimonadaceae bacterium]
MSSDSVRDDLVARIQQRLGDRLTRTVVDDEGRGWVVYAIPARDYDRRTGPCLVFESVEVIRRLRTCPDNWYELSEEDLYTLSLHP